MRKRLTRLGPNNRVQLKVHWEDQLELDFFGKPDVDDPNGDVEVWDEDGVC